MALGDIAARLVLLASFVLTLIVIFAGTQCGGALDDVFIILLDVSSLKAAPGVGPGPNPLATDLGLYDFYTTHVLTYCAGYYDSDGNRNTTMCTTTTVPFAFDLGAVLLADLTGQHVDQTDIDWPIAVIDDFAWISTTTKFMSVLAVLNIVIMGISVLVDGVMLTRTDLSYPYIIRFFSLASLVIMTITTSLGTFLATGFVRLLNHHGDIYDISATGGTQFLALIWVAFALCLLRSLPFLSTLRICVEVNRGPRDGNAEESFRLLAAAEADLAKAVRR